MSLEAFCQTVEAENYYQLYGHVTSVQSNGVCAVIPNAKVGSLCRARAGERDILLEVVSLGEEGHIAMPLDGLEGMELGTPILVQETASEIPVGEALLGTVIDSLCQPYQQEKNLSLPDRVPLYGQALNPLERAVIHEPLDLGIRSLNACLTCGKGQRLGIFAGSGVGKSVALGMMARFTSADVVVIGLIGERGREVKEFIERELSPEARKKCVVVVETSEKSAIRRSRAACVAASVSEYFRDQGADVLLLMDSITRVATARREIGITSGEPPGAKAFPPSTFSFLSRLLERAGNWGERGSITGLYTVLVEGDDMDDPVADNCRAFLDGHIVLSRKLANRGQYPAVDVLSSVSRVMEQVVSKTHGKAARRIRELLARYAENEDAIQYGMYSRGSDLQIDEAIEKAPQIRSFLEQDRDEAVSLLEAQRLLEQLVASEPTEGTV